MAQDISGFGASVRLIASTTFPVGVTITQWADDADPFDAPSVQIADKAMGVNGDMVSWSKANPMLVTLNVIPGSGDDTNLQALFNANRVAKGKRGARDAITLLVTYPDGKVISYNRGKITDGMPGNSISSAGRLKSKAYAFAFESITA